MQILTSEPRCSDSLGERGCAAKDIASAVLLAVLAWLSYRIAQVGQGWLGEKSLGRGAGRGEDAVALARHITTTTCSWAENGVRLSCFHRILLDGGVDQRLA